MASSKSAAAYLIDPLNAPEPSQETGPGTHFGKTLSSAYEGPNSPRSNRSSLSNRTSLGAKNPYRDLPIRSASVKVPSSKPGSNPFDDPPVREAAADSTTSPRQRAGTGSSPRNANGSATHGHHRRTSSLRERYPGDDSVKPLDIIRRDSQRAHRSPHLKKRHMPGCDTIDRLDPAIGGIAYHHEGPYDAALLARNTSFESSPIAALRESNEEALKATPAENIKDAVERHMPLDGVAVVPPGVPDRMGRTYYYEEGTDLLREAGGDGPGYKRWADKDYHPSDLKGRSEPSFSLDRALKSGSARHRSNDSGIELTDQRNRTDSSAAYDRAEKDGLLDTRDPIEIAGGESKYADLEIAALEKERGLPPSSPRARGVSSDGVVRRSGSLRAAGESLKRRIGSLRKSRAEKED